MVRVRGRGNGRAGMSSQKDQGEEVSGELGREGRSTSLYNARMFTDSQHFTFNKVSDSDHLIAVTFLM